MPRRRISKQEYGEPDALAREEIFTQYKRLFSLLNKKYFCGSLPEIEITFPVETTADPKMEACFSYSTDKSEPPKITLQFQEKPEWGISNDTIEQLYHELVHYYCYLHDIEDAYGEYHTLAFQGAVTAHGGACSWTDKNNGYATTTLPKAEIIEILHAL